MAVPPVPGVTVRSEKGRAPQRHEGEVNLRWHEATEWLNQRLTRLSAGGQDQVKLPAGGGQNELRLPAGAGRRRRRAAAGPPPR
jgi:hypothetical protein